MCVWGVSARAFACVCVGGGGGPRAMHACECVHTIFEGL